MKPSDRFYSIIDYTTSARATQADIAAAFARIQEDWVAADPGFVSARFLASSDGRFVRALVAWESEAAFHAFEATSDTAGRMAALDAVFRRLETSGQRATFRSLGVVEPPAR